MKKSWSDKRRKRFLMIGGLKWKNKDE